MGIINGQNLPALVSTLQYWSLHRLLPHFLEVESHLLSVCSCQEERAIGAGRIPVLQGDVDALTAGQTVAGDGMVTGPIVLAHSAHPRYARHTEVEASVEEGAVQGGDELQEQFVGAPDDGDGKTADAAELTDERRILVHPVIEVDVVVGTDPVSPQFSHLAQQTVLTTTTVHIEGLPVRLVHVELDEGRLGRNIIPEG